MYASACSCREEETREEENIRCHRDDRQHVPDDLRAAAVARGADACDRSHRVYERFKRQRYGNIAATKVVLPPVMSISRARSWPLLDTAGRGSCASVDDSYLKEKKNRQTEESNDGKNNVAAQPDGSTQVQARRLLCRHYYPEGGWGWVVTVVSTLVHLLGSGLQLSIPATIALPAKVKFCHPPLHTAGESRYSRTILGLVRL